MKSKDGGKKQTVNNEKICPTLTGKAKKQPLFMTMSSIHARTAWRNHKTVLEFSATRPARHGQGGKP